MIEELKKHAESKGGKCLSDVYVNSHHKYLWEDADGNQWYAAWYSIKSGRWSKQHGAKVKKQKLTTTTIEMLHKKAESKGGKCLSTEYIGNKAKYKWLDSKGRYFEKTWDSIIGGQWSPHEKKERLSQLKTSLTIEEVKEFARSKGAEFLSDTYTRKDRKYKWKDRTGVIFERTFALIEKYGDVLSYVGSSEELELCSFVESLGFEVVRNSRSIIHPHEIDIFIPELGIGIEYHGCMWHTEDRVGREYHNLKRQKAKERGYKLLQFFDFEWKKKKNQVKSFIKSALHKNTERIYARNCEVREVESLEAREFLSRYHILDTYIAPKSYGLYHNEELQGLIVISKHHRDSSELTLSRFVMKSGVNVVGGLSKLCSYAYKIHGAFSTFIDYRWTNEDNWIKAGWKLDYIIPPDYFYYNTYKKQVLSKQSRRKDVVNTPLGMTELQHATLDGLSRIWDCGKVKLIYSN